MSMPNTPEPTDALSVTVEDLVYTLDRAPGRGARAKVVATVRRAGAEGPPLVLDRLDPYSHRARVRLARLVAETTGETEGDVLGHLALLLDTVERAVARPLASTRLELSPARRRAAEKLLASANLLENAAKALGALGCVGEEAAKRLAYLTATSRVLARLTSTLFAAPPGTGKSTLLDAVTSLMPPEDVVPVVRITRAALFHAGEGSLEHRLLVVDEFDGAAEADHALRVLQSRGELSLTETVQGRAVTRSVRGPVAVMSATVAPEGLDAQNFSRFLLVELDAGSEQTARVHEARARAWAGEAGRAPDLDAWRDAQRVLAETAPLAVTIPFAPRLRFPSRSATDRRASEQLLGLVAACATLHARRRERREDGRVVAIAEDYTIVHALLAKSVEATVAGLSARAARVYRHLLETKEPLDRRAITDALGLAYNTAKKALAELHAQELVRVAQAGPPARYRVLGSSILGEGVALTPPEALG